jgi:hypothetical protein
MRISNFVLALSLGVFFAACKSKPKVIESEPVMSETDGETPRMMNFPMAETAVSHSNDEHKVVVKEALNTTRYTYLSVTEDEEEYWIAIPRKDVEIGGTYYYQGGLLKKNFHSQEYDRVFETLYLVSDVSQHSLTAGGGSALGAAPSYIRHGSIAEPPTEVTPVEGAIRIEELISNLEQYEGKVVKITGKCVKVNPMIMGRNWVHLQDGSANNYDLTVTTTEVISLGATVTMEGTIALDKDFGAGYFYDVIMEGAVAK